MQFLFPGVLWGMLALSIPLIVHLFNFRKTKRVYFSNVSLLKNVETQSSSFRKLKRWLIMAARMLFLACLIFAFAQPVWFGKNAVLNQKSPGINGIYLDNSLSMQNTTDNKRFIDHAINKIDELLTVFNKSSNLQLTTNDFDGEDQFIVSSSKIKDRLTTLDFSESPRTLNQIYQRQHAIAQKYNPSGLNHFFWFSDFQKSTIGDLSTLKVDSNDKVHLIPITAKTYQNIFVDSVWLNMPLVRELQNNVLNVKVKNSGNETVEKLPLKLYIDGVQSSTSSVTVGSGGQGIARFNFTVKEKGAHLAKITFDDQPIVFDNEYFFVLNASPTVRVLHLFGSRSVENYFSKMYSNDSLFNYQSFPVQNFDPGIVKNSDLVIAEGMSKIEGELKNVLIEFLNQGGNVFISPSENPDLSQWQSFIGQYGINNIEKTKDVPSPQFFLEINEPDKASPFYEGVFENSTYNALVSLPKNLPLLKWGGVAEKILSFKNGQAFLTNTKIGDGNLYLLASPISSKFGNFAEHAFFVPTFYKMASLSSKADRISYSFEEGGISFFMPDAPLNASYTLKNKNLEIIPAQRVIGKTLYLTLPKSSELDSGQPLAAGYYDLMINGKKVKTIALNHSNKESDLSTIKIDDIKSTLKEQSNIEVYDNIFDGDFVEAFRNTSVGKPLWKYFLIAALFFLLAEMLLSRFMKG